MPASPESPGLARRFVRAYAARHGIRADLHAALALCVSEAVSNVVVHVYRALDEPGEVQVEAHKPDSYLYLYVRDHGGGLAPRQDTPRSASDCRSSRLRSQALARLAALA